MVCYIIILKHFEITGISVQKCDNCFCGGGGGFPLTEILTSVQTSMEMGGNPAAQQEETSRLPWCTC